MLRSIAHRGPDDQHHVRRRAGGDRHAPAGDHRPRRRPPAADRTRTARILVTQNGEIYNYVELRDELERARPPVPRRTATPRSIVHLYEDHGDRLRRAPPRDVRDRDLGRVAAGASSWPATGSARSRSTGGCADGRLTYGSELKALLAGRDAPRESSTARAGAVPPVPVRPRAADDPRGRPEAAARVSILTWDGGEPRDRDGTGRRPTSRSSTSEPRGRRRGAASSSSASPSASACGATCPVGVFLSGGMDSSVGHRLMAEAVATRSGRSRSASRNAASTSCPTRAAVAQQFGTVHTEEVVRLDAIDLLPDACRRTTTSRSATPRRSRRSASRSSPPAHLKVVLTGDGGDESFGGYLRYRCHVRWLVSGLGGRARVPAVGVGPGVQRADAPATVRLRRRADSWRPATVRPRPPTSATSRLMTQMHAHAPGARSSATHGSRTRTATSLGRARGGPTRRARPDAPRRHPDLPARGPAGQDGPGDDGELARGPRPAARPRARRVRGAAPGRAQDRTGSDQGPPPRDRQAACRPSSSTARRWASASRSAPGSAGTLGDRFRGARPGARRRDPRTTSTRTSPRRLLREHRAGRATTAHGCGSC